MLPKLAKPSIHPIRICGQENFVFLVGELERLSEEVKKIEQRFTAGAPAVSAQPVFAFDGDKFSFKLAQAKFAGVFASGTQYVIGDFVVYSDGIWLLLVPEFNGNWDAAAGWHKVCDMLPGL